MTRRQYYVWWTVSGASLLIGAALLYTPAGLYLAPVCGCVGLGNVIYAYRKGWVHS